MASFFTDLAKSFVERGINRAIEESRYICCFKCIAEEFEKERVSLEAEKNTVGQRIKVATRKGEDIQANARHWEEEADKLIEKDTVIEQNCFFGLSPDCIWRYRRGKELADKTKLIKRMMENGDKLENVGLPACPLGIERYSSQHFISFKSRELKNKQLLDALVNESNYLTGLYGMGGTGKTTLIKEVGKELKQLEQFSLVIDATVSYTPDIKKIQDEIAGSLEVSLEDCNESDRPKKLLSRLTNGEKILVILDDVWDTGDRDLNPPLDFDAIGIPKSDNHKGCRVLMTTRSKRVLNKMECDTIIELELLSEEDAWSMFQHYAGLSNTTSSTVLIEMGRKIAKECKRLPVAIAPIARSLKGIQHREEWVVTLKSLQNPVSSMCGTFDNYLVGVHNCLKFSYDYMKDEKAKGLFLLCSVFPEDQVISVEILTRLGIAAGIFGDDYGSYDDARSQVVVAKNKLLSSCLLLETDKGDVRMHDLVREVAQLIANKEIQTVNMSNKNNKSFLEREKNIKYLLCEGRDVDVFSGRFDGSKLEILIYFFYVDNDRCNKEVSTLLFENHIGRLRALYLYNTKWKHLALSLPLSIQSTNIRSLMVSKVDLGDISVLGNMQSLETLDLERCTINELPCEITKLENFRLLKLQQCEIRKNDPFEVIHGCSSLEELYFYNSFTNYCRDISFSNLQRYHVYRDMPLHECNESQSKIVSYDGNEDRDMCFFSKATLEYCMQTTEVLRLNGTEREWRNIIPEIVPIDQGMNDLLELSLGCISQLKFLIDTTDCSHRVPNVFSKLVELELYEMENLEELCNGPLSVDSLKNLEEINIEHCDRLGSFFKCNLNLCHLKRMKILGCPMLVSLFQLSTSQSLVLLEELIIAYCERLENIMTVYGEDETEELIIESENNSKSHHSLFPKLKTLQILKCPRLECILPFIPALDLPVLKTIEISECDRLKFIFSQYVELGSVEEMDLSWLPNFIDIFPHLTSSSSFVKGTSSTSISGSKVAQTQLDLMIRKKNWWTHICCFKHKSKATSVASESNSNTTWERVQCLQSHVMCYIKDIQLVGISKIKYVFILSITPTMLLETLTIDQCDHLRQIVVDTRDDSGGNILNNVFPKLKRLDVTYCEQLEYIFGQYNAHDDQSDHNQIHLHLPVLDQLDLKNLPNLIAMCAKKYRMFSPLTILKLRNCSSQVAIKSIGDFIMPSVSRSLESTIIKELSGSAERFCALKKLWVENMRVENIFCLDEINGQPMNLELQSIRISDMPIMTCLFLGPQNSFSLQNFTTIQLLQCEKLEIIFTTSIIRCLPHLVVLRIENCNELKHIIEDDYMVNQNMSCFPKLEILIVMKCNKLKCVFPVSACKRLPELKAIMIRDADELEEIFKSEGDHKVEISNLTFLILENLPSLYQIRGIQFQKVEYQFVQNCRKLSFTITLPTIDFYRIMCNFDQVAIDTGMDLYLIDQLHRLEKRLIEENTRVETTEDFVVGNEIQTALKHELTSSQFLTERDDQSIGEASTSKEAITTVLSTNSEIRNKPPTQLVTSKHEDFKITVEEGTTSSTHLNSVGSSSCALITAERKTSPLTPPVDNAPILDIPSVATLPTNSEELLHEQKLMNRTYPLAETDSTIKHFQGDNDDGDGQTVLPSLSIVTEDVNIRDSLETTKANNFPYEAEIEELHLENCLMNQTHPLAETPPTIKSSQGDDSLEEKEDKRIQEISASETRNEPPIQLFASKQKGIKRNDEEGTTFYNAQKMISSTHSKSFSFKCKTSSQDDSDDQIAIMTSSSTAMEDVHVRGSQKISEIHHQGNPSQVMEDLNSPSILRLELEQLVLKKHLESENLSLLIDFLVKHPSNLLTDNSLSNRYKGYAYTCLAELLKFLQTHSVLDVLGSSRSEFVELLQDVRRCAFDKAWLDGIERRALFTGLQFSQDQDAILQNLLESKGILTQHVEDLRRQLASLEAFLESVIQQETQVLEARNALSTPLGY